MEKEKMCCVNKGYNNMTERREKEVKDRDGVYKCLQEEQITSRNVEVARFLALLKSQRLESKQEASSSRQQP